MKLQDAWVIVTGPEVGAADAGMYWRARAAGYTWDLGDAGVYAEVDAKRRAGARDNAIQLVELLGMARPDTVGSLVLDCIEDATARANSMRQGW